MPDPSKNGILTLFETLLRSPRFWGFGVVAWCLFLVLYGAFKLPAPGIALDHIDKVYHFGYYAAGAFAATLARDLAVDAPLRNAVIVMVGFALFGAADEFVQSLLPHRSGNDVGDWTADVLGAAAGLAAARLALRLAGTRDRKNAG